MQRFLLAVAAATVAGSWGQEVIPAPPAFDCAMRKLAYDFGRDLIPRAAEFE